MDEQIVAQIARFSGLSFQPNGCGVQHPVAIVRSLQSETGHMKRLSSRLHFRLPFCLRSACSANDTPPFGRTLSCQRFAPRLSGVDSSPETSSGPLPRIVSSRLVRGARRHTLRSSMYRIQRANPNNGAKDNGQQGHLHRSSRKECRSQNYAEQQGIRSIQPGDKREMEERKGRLRKPH